MPPPSSLPPPPPGLPARPAVDSYRPSPTRNAPPPRRNDNYEPSSRRNEDMYEFRGNDNTRGDDDRDGRDNSSKYPLRSRNGGDSYRPGAAPPGTSGGFSFQMEAPPSIDLGRMGDSRMGDSYRPAHRNEHHPGGQGQRRGAHAQGNGRNDRRPHPQGRDGGRRDRPGRGGASNGPRRWVPTAERPFLRTNRSPTPDLMPGMAEDESAAVKFRPLEDMSDSDEADMSVSSEDEPSKDAAADADADADGGEPKKKARTALDTSKDGDSVPKWSNPDPYFVLPPSLDDPARKKTDVVKLIRKARVSTGNEVAKHKDTADDFISFDFDDDDEKLKAAEDTPDESEEEDAGRGMPGAPTGPSAGAAQTNGATSRMLKFDDSEKVHPDLSPDEALGNRKRTHDDEIKGDVPSPLRSKKGRQEPPKQILGIIKEWRAKPGDNPTPWCTVDHSATLNMGAWLHKEIVDFYYHVKPRDFEDRVRGDLIERLNRTFQRRWKDSSIHAFGSYVAGLYLPTADMDLVMVSKSFIDGYPGIYDRKKHFFLVGDMVEREGIAVPGTVQVIHKARVPLVKFVDRRTGLQVDISFENDSGLIANSTFKEWKERYPAMPILVTLVKQFLAMRGLNEPANGGIGGLSVTCLVVSLLQLMPQVQSGNMVPEHHLGEILMEFLDLYGRQFNVSTTAISLRPPGYVPKNRLPQTLYRGKPQKFCILDPNNSSNDISGGASNTPAIQKAFATAYDELQKRMLEVHKMPIEERKGRSVLGVVLGGDYGSFETQRERLRGCAVGLEREGGR